MRRRGYRDEEEEEFEAEEPLLNQGLDENEISEITEKKAIDYNADDT